VHESKLRVVNGLSRPGEAVLVEIVKFFELCFGREIKGAGSDAQTATFLAQRCSNDWKLEWAGSQTGSAEKIKAD
jgi:hypothetical protein